MAKIARIIIVSLIIMIVISYWVFTIGCASAPIVITKEVEIPIAVSCPAPPIIKKPEFVSVIFNPPLEESGIVSLNEMNIKKLIKAYYELTGYSQQLEEALKAYEKEELE